MTDTQTREADGALQKTRRVPPLLRGETLLDDLRRRTTSVSSTESAFLLTEMSRYGGHVVVGRDLDVY